MKSLADLYLDLPFIFLFIAVVYNIPSLSFLIIVVGTEGIRTRDILHVKQALYQLSYIPMVDKVGFEPTTYRVSGGCSTRLSYMSILSAPSIGIEPMT